MRSGLPAGSPGIAMAVFGAGFRVSVFVGVASGKPMETMSVPASVRESSDVELHSRRWQCGTYLVTADQYS